MGASAPLLLFIRAPRRECFNIEVILELGHPGAVSALHLQRTHHIKKAIRCRSNFHLETPINNVSCSTETGAFAGLRQ